MHYLSVFYLCLGVILFAIAVLDIIKTTFSSNGGGMVTKQLPGL